MSDKPTVPQFIAKCRTCRYCVKRTRCDVYRHMGHRQFIGGGAYTRVMNSKLSECPYYERKKESLLARLFRGLGF